MLNEVKDVSQVPGEPFRRWFADTAMDLIVWYGADRGVSGFQLCYREGVEEKALTWQVNRGFTHRSVDDGEGVPFRHKMTPILVPDGVFDRDGILGAFKDASKDMDRDLAAFVISMIEKYSA